jgi:hypothetical protein
MGRLGNLSTTKDITAIQLHRIKYLLSQLPRENYFLLGSVKKNIFFFFHAFEKFFFFFSQTFHLLNIVAHNSHVNLMDVDQIADLIGPAIVGDWARFASTDDIDKRISREIFLSKEECIRGLVSFIIENFPQIFTVIFFFFF